MRTTGSAATPSLVCEGHKRARDPFSEQASHTLPEESTGCEVTKGHRSCLVIQLQLRH